MFTNSVFIWIYTKHCLFIINNESSNVAVTSAGFSCELKFLVGIFIREWKVIFSAVYDYVIFNLLNNVRWFYYELVLYFSPFSLIIKNKQQCALQQNSVKLHRTQTKLIKNMLTRYVYSKKGRYSI